MKTPFTVKSASTSCAPNAAVCGGEKQTVCVTYGPTFLTNTGMLIVWPCRLALSTQTVSFVTPGVHWLAAVTIAGSAGLATTTSPASVSSAPASAFALTTATTLPILVPGAAVRLAV